MSELEAPVVPAAAPAEPPAPAAPPAQGAQNTGESATPPDPTGEKTEPTTGQAPEKQGKSRFERRLDRAYRRAAEEKARADFFEKQMAELKAAPKEEKDPSVPRMEQFSDIEEYATAKAKYERDKALKEHEAKQLTEKQRQYVTQLSEQWETKASKADAKYDDFDEVVGDLKPTSPWAVAVMEADNAEDVAYYLGKHIDEARAIAAMSPTAQIRAIGRLEAKLSAEPPKPKEASKAPAPITPVSGTKTAPSDELSDDDDMRTYIRKRNKQLGR